MGVGAGRVIRGVRGVLITGVVAQLVERLFRIQEAWGSIPYCSIFLYTIIFIHYPIITFLSNTCMLVLYQS